MGTQQFCLKWNNHQTNMLVVFEQLLGSEALVDVTLACEGLSLKAHKVVLSACSPFFQSLFLENPCKHPIVILKDMKYKDLKAIIDFMYRGEVNVSQDQLSALLKTAETLKVKGLAEVTGEQRHGTSGVVQEEILPQASSQTVHSSNTQQQRRIESPPLNRKKRSRPRRRSRSDSNCSDTEDHVPSKIKEPDSPEIVEEISRDTTHCSELRQTSNHSQSLVPIPHQTSHPISSEKPVSSLSSVQDTCMTVEEPPSSDQTEYEMEQTLTDSVPVYSEAPSQGAILPQVSNQLSITAAVGITDPQSHHATDSQALVPCNIPSEPSVSSHITDDTTQDIKPLVTYDEPPISPVAGPSHQDSNSMMFMDNSVSALPGPSGFQDQSQSQSQPQGVNDGNHVRKSFSSYVVRPFRAHLHKMEKGKNTSKIQELDSECLECTPKCNIAGSHTQISSRHLSASINSVDHTNSDLNYQVVALRNTSCVLPSKSLDINKPYSQRKNSDINLRCNICKKLFSGKGNLNRHMRKHTGERPYQCSFCGKCFNQKSNLVIHYRVHTGEKPYRCQHCDISFAQKIHLQRHILTHAPWHPYRFSSSMKTFAKKCQLISYGQCLDKNK